MDFAKGQFGLSLGKRDTHACLRRPQKLAAKPLAAGNGPGGFNLGLEPREALEVLRAHQGTVDAGRTHLQGVGPRQRVLDIENRRNGVADLGAIVDRHGAAVPAFRHYLQGGADRALHHHPDEVEIHGFEYGLEQSFHPVTRLVHSYPSAPGVPRGLRRPGT